MASLQTMVFFAFPFGSIEAFDSWQFLSKGSLAHYYT